MSKSELPLICYERPFSSQETRWWLPRETVFLFCQSILLIICSILTSQDVRT